MRGVGWGIIKEMKQCFVITYCENHFCVQCKIYVTIVQLADFYYQNYICLKDVKCERLANLCLDTVNFIVQVTNQVISLCYGS